MAAFEVATSEMALGLHVSDCRLDGGSPFELSLDGAEHAALLS